MSLGVGRKDSNHCPVIEVHVKAGAVSANDRRSVTATPGMGKAVLPTRVRPQGTHSGRRCIARIRGVGDRVDKPCRRQA